MLALVLALFSSSVMMFPELSTPRCLNFLSLQELSHSRRSLLLLIVAYLQSSPRVNAGVHYIFLAASYVRRIAAKGGQKINIMHPAHLGSGSPVETQHHQ